jgi:hypothetical protein
MLNGTYEPVQVLGHGGFGTVLLARDVLIGRPIAVKVMHDHRTDTDDFVAEMQFLASLNHPSIVTFYHHFRHEDRLYLVMEYCPGGSLRRRLANGPLGQEQAIEYVKSVAETLAFVHAKGVVHHDIKPDNLLLGPGDLLKVGDFGIANQLGGTVAYLAPELHIAAPVGKNDGRVDVYSLGITLLELLEGSLLFHGMAQEEVLAHKHNRDFIPRGLEPWVREVLLKALQPDPELRFQNMAEFKEAIETHHVRYVVDADRVRAHALATEAQRLLNQHKLVRARKIIDQALAYGRDSVPARVVAGRYNLVLANTEEATQFFQEAIRLNPRVQIQKELGWLAMEKGDYPYAISMLNDHLQRESSDYEAANLLVQCFFELGRFSYARQVCEMMLKTRPKNTCFSNNGYISSVLETGDRTEAEKFGGRIRDDPFMQYNRRMVDAAPDKLKDKLLFQEYRFGQQRLSENTLVLQTPAASRTFTNPIVTIGRDEANLFVIADRNVSRWHCLLVNFRDDVWLYDLNSAWGTEFDHQSVAGRIRVDGVHEIAVPGIALRIASSEDRLI